jgi:hypothetical protein
VCQPLDTTLCKAHVARTHTFLAAPSLTPSSSTVQPTTAQQGSTHTRMTLESEEIPDSQPPTGTYNVNGPPYPGQQHTERYPATDEVV